MHQTITGSIRHCSPAAQHCEEWIQTYCLDSLRVAVGFFLHFGEKKHVATVLKLLSTYTAGCVTLKISISLYILQLIIINVIQH